MCRKTVLLAALAAAMLLTGCGERAGESASLEAPPVREEPVISEPTVEASVEAEAALPEMAEGLADWTAAYFEQVLAYDAETPEAEYALIDLTGGGIPALAAGHGGCVSLYQYGNGELHTLMDRWTYGYMGKYEYEYLPGQQVIRSLRRHDADEEGTALYTNYFFVKADYTLDTYTISRWYSDAMDLDYEIDGDERFSKVTHFYLAEEEITKDTYEDYDMNGAFLYICGDKRCREFLEGLNVLTGMQEELT